MRKALLLLLLLQGVLSRRTIQGDSGNSNAQDAPSIEGVGLKLQGDGGTVNDNDPGTGKNGAVSKTRATRWACMGNCSPQPGQTTPDVAVPPTADSPDRNSSAKSPSHPVGIEVPGGNEHQVSYNENTDGLLPKANVLASPVAAPDQGVVILEASEQALVAQSPWQQPVTRTPCFHPAQIWDQLPWASFL
eukprot:jgi/Botrbrau1/19067/Bobra.0795s0004.1